MTRSLFEGNTVALRPFEPDDVPALEAYLNHPDLVGRRYVPGTFPDTAPLSRQQIQEIVEKWAETEKGLQLAIVERESGALIGHAECGWDWDPHNPSLSLVIAPGHQRQGHGTETMGLLLRYLFKHTVAHNVTCWIADWNHSARRFAASRGFQERGCMRRAGVRQGQYFDMILLDLLRPEWVRSRGGSHAA
jgi:RimJ/RimL family protein N-acetyltransferase